MPSKRIVSLDLISGILIILLILYHAAQWGRLTETSIYINAMYIFYFLMPWFYFKSGYVHKKDYSLTKFIKVTIFPILFLIVIGTCASFIIELPGLLNNNEPIATVIVSRLIIFLKYGMTTSNPPLWFLVSLLFVKLSIYFIVKLNYKLIMLIAVLFAFIGWVQHYYFPQLDIGAHKALFLGISFALIGYLYKHKNIIELTNSYKIRLIVICITSALLLTSYVHVRFNDLQYGYYWVYYVNCILAIGSLLLIFKNIVWQPLIWVGQRTIIFFVLPWPQFYILFYLCRFLGIPQEGWTFMIILSVFTLLGSIIIAKYLPLKYITITSSKIVEISALIIQKLSGNRR